MAVRQGWQGRFHADNTWSTLLTMNTNQAHSRAHVGESSEFGRARRPSAGVVTIRTRPLNQDAVEVLSSRRTSHVHRRDAAGAGSVFPQAATPLSVEDEQARAGSAGPAR